MPVAGNNSTGPWRYFTQYRCLICGCQVAFKSRPRGFAEMYLLPWLRLRPVRCSNCFHRDLRPMSVPVRDSNLEPASPANMPGRVA